MQSFDFIFGASMDLQIGVTSTGENSEKRLIKNYHPVF